MDNAVPASEKDGKATFTIGTSPVYVRGLTGDAKVTLGAPDHSDAKPGPNAVALADLGDGSWKLSAERDIDYEDSPPRVHQAASPANSRSTQLPGRTARARRWPSIWRSRTKERRTMPFYTTLVPAKPIVIPGKASHLGLWVKAASDWGRVVYCLKDAKGERWLSASARRASGTSMTPTTGARSTSTAGAT